MSNGTVELNHKNFLSKLDVIEDAISYLDSNINFSKINNISKCRFEMIKHVFNGIKNNYDIDVVTALTKYYDDDTDNKHTIDNYNTQVMGGNYCSKLQQCYDFIKGIYTHMLNNGMDKISSELGNIINRYNSCLINTYVKDVTYDMCPCGVKMKVYPETSELICDSCGYVVTLYGTVFEDTQFYNQEGQRSKHGCYDPSRHCKFWVLRIQAKENADISNECLDKMLYCIKRDKIKDSRKLMCYQIRSYLKETKFTEFNDHIPLIRKLITGVVPPQLTREELMKLYNLFDKAVNTFETVKPEGKSNTMYYPYIIYKILDFIIKKSIRKRHILECIHLQSRDTLIANDNLWELVCAKLPDLQYKPTDRNDQMIDI